MRFFFDNHLSPFLAQAVHQLIEPDGHQVTHLRRKFPSDTDDENWVEVLGNEGDWIIISGDIGILRKRHTREVWKRAKLTMFVFAKGFTNRKFWEQNVIVIRCWPHIMDMASGVAAGAPYKVPLRIGGKNKLELFF